MPRKPKPPGEQADTVRITVNPIIRQYLEKLRLTGLYGNDQPQAALKLITMGIERAIESRLISRIHSDEGQSPSHPS